MIAYLRYGFAAVIAVIFVTVAVANRAFVEIKLLPDALAALLGFNFSLALPVFLLLGLAIVLGLVLGFVWEWFREHGYRAEAAKLRRETASMRAELQRAEKVAPQMRKDDVLALVESK
jgi:lipopolysaccharide assembly protein A